MKWFFPKSSVASTQFSGYLKFLSAFDLSAAFHFLLHFSYLLWCSTLLWPVDRGILLCLSIQCWGSSSCAYCFPWDLIHAHCSGTTHNAGHSQIYASSPDFSKLHIMYLSAYMTPSLGILDSTCSELSPSHQPQPVLPLHSWSQGWHPHPPNCSSW